MAETTAKCARCEQPTAIKEARPDEGSVVLVCGCKLSASNLATMGVRIADDGLSLVPIE